MNLLFYPTARGQMTGRIYRVRTGIVNGNFSPLMSNVDFHWWMLERIPRRCCKCVYLTGEHAAVKTAIVIFLTR